MDLETVKSLLKSFPNFPKPGILFHDIHSILRIPLARDFIVKQLVTRYKEAKLDAIVGLESRGYYFGSIVAHELGIPFVVIRKAGKLPGPVKRLAYGLEYGNSEMDIALESVSEGQRVVVMDDLMATGGTAAAACQLLQALKVIVVEVHCLIEMVELNGKSKLDDPVAFFSLLQL